MTLAQLQTYIVGVLQGYFPNKAVLDKLSENIDGTLLFDGKQISGGTIVTDSEVQQAIADTLAELGLANEIVEASVATFAALQDAIANGANAITITEPLEITQDTYLRSDTPVAIATSVADAFTVTKGTLTIGENIKMTSDISLLYAKNGGSIVVDGATLVNASTEECLGAVGADSTFIMKSGTMISEGSVIAALGSNGRFVMTGGTIETVGGTEENPYCAVFAYDNAVAEITGGSVNAALGYGLIASVKGTVKVSGGTVDGVKAHNGSSAVAEICGGTIHGKIATEDEAVLTVTGGTFDVDPSEYVAKDCTVVSSNGTYTVVKNA